MNFIASSQFQLGLTCCCLVCLVATGIIYFGQKKLATNASKLFSGLLTAVLLFVIVDAASYLIEVGELPYNPIFCECLLFIYCILTLVILYLVTNYGYMSAVTKRKSPSSTISLTSAVPAIISLVAFLYLVITGNFAHIGSDGFGLVRSSLYVLFFNYVVYSIENLILIISNKGKWYLPVLLFVEGTIIIYDGFVRGYLPLSFYATIDIIILLNLIQHPKYYISDSLHCFNKKAFTHYIRDLELRKQNYYIVTIDIVHFGYFVSKLGDELSEKILKNLLEMLPENTSTSCKFNYEKDIFAFVTTSKTEYLALLDYWKNNLHQYWDIDGNRVNVSFLVTHFFKSNEIFNDNMPGFVRNYLDFEKGTHRSRVVYINDRIPLMNREQKITGAISKAIASDNFDVYFQPIINLQTGKFEKAEVLARLTDDKLGFIPPYEFITTAERKGMISDVTKQIITKTIQTMSANDFVNLGIKNVNINLSSLEVGDDSVLSFIDEIIQKYELKPENLTIELTETAHGGSYEMLSQFSSAFKEKGYRLALDDYGTGYSSLDRILAIPFDYIKIDKTMLELVTPQKEILLKSTIDMLKKCGYQVIVEGVESEEIANLMKESHVDFIQGFYYAKPMNVEDTIKFIKERNA